MRTRAIVLAGLLAVGTLLLGMAHLFTEGALFSRPQHLWRVEVDADGEAPWRLELPTLAAGGASEPELAALLAELRVVGGDATFERREDALVVEGRADATLVARRTFWGMRDAPFADWHATGTDAVRLDADAPAQLRVTWSLDLVAGGGHTCGGEGSWRAALAPGERAVLTTTDAKAEPLSTSAPPVRMWCH